MSGVDDMRWQTLLAESEERLAELSDAQDDPVAQRRFTAALSAKGRALSELGRPKEAIAVWDEIVRRSAVESLGEPPTILIRALLRKMLDLRQLEQNAEAIDAADTVLALCESATGSDLIEHAILAALTFKVDGAGTTTPELGISLNDEITRRLGDSDDPRISRQVTASFARKGVLLLVAGRVDEAIQVSHVLGERVTSAPDERLLADADLAGRFARSLMLVAGTTWRDVGEVAAFATANTVRELVGAATGRLRSTPVLRHVIPHRDRLPPGRTPPPRNPARRRLAQRPFARHDWDAWRRRLRAGLELNEVIITRLGSDPDPEAQRIVMIARVSAANVRGISGNMVAGARELHRLMDGGEPAAVQAFQSLASGYRGRADVTSQINELSMLSARALTLGQDDTRIARIAYEDSVRDVVGATTHRRVRWIAALLTPGGRRVRVGPEWLSEWRNGRRPWDHRPAG